MLNRRSDVDRGGGARSVEPDAARSDGTTRVPRPRLLHEGMPAGLSLLFRTGASLALVAATTGCLLALAPLLSLNGVTIIYTVPILLSAIWCGILPAVIAVVASILALAFFFYPPHYSLYIADPEDIIDLVVFLSVALVTSHLVNKVGQHAAAAHRREKEMADLYTFSRRLAVSRTAADIYAAIRDHLSSAIQRKVLLFTPGGADFGGSIPSEAPARLRQAAAEMLGRDPSPGETSIVKDAGQAWLLRPVSPNRADFGVLAVGLGGGSSDVGAIGRQLEGALADATATLERLDIDRAIGEAKVRAEAEVLREALIGSVSHELRAPLSSILGAATVLAEAPGIGRDRRLGPLADVIRDEAERLNAEIQVLLDAARVNGHDLRPRLQLTDPIDVVNAAVERRSRRLSGHRVELDLLQDLPFVNIDPVLVEQALGQILDNAAKYSPGGSAIRVTARGDGERVVISVGDQGDGLSRDEQDRLCDRFFRGRRHASTVSGSGLGLWIAEAFVRANGGTLAAASEGEGRGTTVSIALPASREALHAVDD
jgi:K+-sensing histidine kinase KdpD